MYCFQRRQDKTSILNGIICGSFVVNACDFWGNCNEDIDGIADIEGIEGIEKPNMDGVKESDDVKPSASTSLSDFSSKTALQYILEKCNQTKQYYYSFCVSRYLAGDLSFIESSCHE